MKFKIMEQNTVVYPPNKNLQRPLNFSTSPVIYNHLLFLDFNEKDESIVGSSNLSGSLWENTLFFFKTEDELLDFNYSLSYINSTASDGQFLNDQTIALAEDTGILNILSISEERNIIESINYFRNFERIPQLSLWKSESKVLTCSGRSAAIWDIKANATNPVHCFDKYHSDQINSVDCLISHPNIFLTASTDRKSCIWDCRNPVAASLLYSNEFSSLTSIAFNPTNSNQIVVGTEAGDIYLLDDREPNEFLTVFNCFQNNIHRIKFNNSTNYLAVCGDLNEIILLKCENNSLVQSNIENDVAHEGIVRGLAWSKDNHLFSCGFDKKVLKHLL